MLEALLAEAPAAAKDALQRSIDSSTKAEGAAADALERSGTAGGDGAGGFGWRDACDISADDGAERIADRNARRQTDRYRFAASDRGARPDVYAVRSADIDAVGAAVSSARRPAHVYATAASLARRARG